MRYTYSVWIKTGQQALAGTDSTIVVQLFGTQGQSELITIPQDDVYAFDVDSTDRVTIETDTALGDLTRCCLGHQGNIDLHWFVETVRIRDNVTQDEWHFAIHDWVRQALPDQARTCADVTAPTA